MLGLISLLTLGLVTIVLGEQRSLLGEERSQRAAMLADSALDQGLIYLHRNAAELLGRTAASDVFTLWRPCTSAMTSPPCGDGLRNLYDQRWLALTDVPMSFTRTSGTGRAHYLTRASENGLPVFETVTIVAEGETPDGVGRARQSLSVRVSPRVNALASAPVIASGSVRLEEDVSVVVGSEIGRPRSVWSSADARFVGASRSCLRSEFLGVAESSAVDGDRAGHCPDAVEGLLSTAALEGIDVFDRDGNTGVNPDTARYISDPLLQFFGISLDKALLLKRAATLVANCSNWDPPTAGFFWIDGECRIPSARSIGSVNQPLVLIVSAGDLILQQDSSLHALVVMLPRSEQIAHVELSANARLHGALISTQALTVVGQGALVHDVDLLRVATQPVAGLMALTPIPGSWRDW